MKPYGLPRDSDAEWPDKDDAQFYARKGHRMRNKNLARIVWKKKARNESKRIIQDFLNKLDNKND